MREQRMSRISQTPAVGADVQPDGVHAFPRVGAAAA